MAEALSSFPGGTTAKGSPYRWVMFGGMVGVYFAFGMMVASIPPMITIVRDDLGIARGPMGLALGAWTAMYIVTAPIAGRVVDRLGIKWSLLVGGLATVATGIARSFAEGLGTLWLAVAIFGVGGPLVSASAPTLCAQWFPDAGERRFAVSTYNVGPGLGSVVVIWATNSILLPWLGDWRAVVRFESYVALALTALWVVIALRAPAINRTSVTRRRPTPLVQEWSGLLRSPDMRHALLLGALTFFMMHSLNNWMVDALSEQASISAGSSATWVAVAGLGGMTLLFVGPSLATRFGRAWVLTGTWIMLMIGFLLIAFGSPPLAILGAFAASFRSLLIPMLLLSVMDARGVDESNIGAANGLWFAAAQVGAVAGPPIIGIIGDTDAGFGGAMLLLGAVGVIAVTLIQRWKQPHQPAA